VTLRTGSSRTASWATLALTTATLAPKGCVPAHLPDTRPGKLFVCVSTALRSTRPVASPTCRPQRPNRAGSRPAGVLGHGLYLSNGYRFAGRQGKTFRLKPERETRLTTAAKAMRLAAGSVCQAMAYTVPRSAARCCRPGRRRRAPARWSGELSRTPGVPARAGHRRQVRPRGCRPRRCRPRAPASR
jgi:hypothetical protein